MEFTNNHGSITDEKESTARTYRTNSHQTKSQTDSRHVLKPQTSDNKQQHRSSLIPQQNSVHTHLYKDNYIQNKERNINIIEMIEKQDPSEETLKLTTRWRVITKHGDFRYTQGQLKRYNREV